MAFSAAVLSVGACHTERPPCTAPNCPKGAECLANRCVPRGAQPVAPNTQRIVVEPVAVAVTTERGPDVAGSARVVFGGAAVGGSTLYLRFGDAWKSGGAIDSAFLLLEPVEEAEPSSGRVDIQVWVISEQWDARELSRRNRPGLAPPSRPGLADTHPARTLRIDITEIARHLQDKADDYGFAVQASATDGYGATYTTGLADGQAPRLELYVRAQGDSAGSRAASLESDRQRP